MVELIALEVVAGLLQGGLSKMTGIGATKLFNPKDDSADVLRKIHEDLRGIAPRIDELTDMVDGIQESLSDLRDIIVSQHLFERWERALADVASLPKRTRAPVGSVSMQIQNVVKHSAVEDLVFQVQKWEQDMEDPEEYYMSTLQYAFNETDTESAITKTVVTMEEECQLFSGIEHVTKDRLTIKVEAWAPNERTVQKLARATGTLYYLGKTMVTEIADPRGVFLQLAEGGTGMSTSSTVSHGSMLNSAMVSIGYGWIPPSSMANFERFKEKANFDLFHKAFLEVERKQKVKNIYLVGLTGEGKSTLANRLVGTDLFAVSDAGTGTFDIKGEVVQSSGAIKCPDHQVQILDTPGLNDGLGMDAVFENRMFQHLTREQTVSGILVVSKDGSRIPAALTAMMSIYRKAFGEAWVDCLTVIIGLNANKITPAMKNSKKRMFVKKLTEHTGQSFPRDRVFFFDARDDDPQEEIKRLSDVISTAPIAITGTGNTIYQGLLKLQSEANNLERTAQKERMAFATSELVYALLADIETQPRIRFKYDFDEHTSKIKFMRKYISMGRGMKLHSNLKLRLPGKLSRRPLEAAKKVQDDDDDDDELRAKELRFEPSGPGAVAVMKSVGYPMIGVHDIARIHVLFRRMLDANLILTKMETTTDQTPAGLRRVIHNYAIIDVEGHLEGGIRERISKILDDLLADPQAMIRIQEAIDSDSGGVRG